MTRRPYIVGNWKMHGTRAMLSEARAIDRAAQRHMKVEVALAPPFTLIHPIHREAEQISVGAQDCHQADGGAYTGDISAAMVADAGAKFVILGHSERRHGLGELDALLHQKLSIALESGLAAVLCVGETLSERDDGRAEGVVRAQLRGCFGTLSAETVDRAVVAYEPVWAIGTGRTASPEDAQRMHAAIRKVLGDLYDSRFAAKTRIIYGGSVNSKNARAIFDQPDVDGGLIGGASLKAGDFASICRAAAEAWSAAGGH